MRMDRSKSRLLRWRRLRSRSEVKHFLLIWMKITLGDGIFIKSPWPTAVLSGSSQSVPFLKIESRSTRCRSRTLDFGRQACTVPLFFSKFVFFFFIPTASLPQARTRVCLPQRLDPLLPSFISSVEIWPSIFTKAISMFSPAFKRRTKDIEEESRRSFFTFSP